MMTSYNDLLLDDEYKLRISSKKLKSGRYQVKFYATVKAGKELYGYLLVDPEETLKSVIGKLRLRLKSIDIGEGLFLTNIVSLEKETKLMIFQ